jgi:hypothetical protein
LYFCRLMAGSELFNGGIGNDLASAAVTGVIRSLYKYDNRLSHYPYGMVKNGEVTVKLRIQ